MTTQYLEVFDIITETEAHAFNYDNYREGERTILTPALEAKGYTNISFYDVERDSFGVLVRGAHATDHQGNLVKLFYG